MATTLWNRDIVGDANGVKTTFSSWDACMSKTYCKYPVIVAIVVGSLIVLSVVWCAARCLCCGAECCCGCLACCNACCPSPRGRRNKGYEQPPPQVIYHQPAPQYQSHPQPQYASGGGYRGPTTATFDQPSAARKGGGATATGAYKEDALPAMPSWSTATNRRVEEVEMDDRSPTKEHERVPSPPNDGLGTYYEDPEPPSATHSGSYYAQGGMAAGAMSAGALGAGAVGGMGAMGRANSPYDRYGGRSPGPNGAYGQGQQRNNSYGQGQQRNDSYGQGQRSPYGEQPNSPYDQQQTDAYGQPQQRNSPYPHSPQGYGGPAPFGQQQPRNNQYMQVPQRTGSYGPSQPQQNDAYGSGQYQPPQRDYTRQQQVASPLSAVSGSQRSAYPPTYHTNPTSPSYETEQPSWPAQPQTQLQHQPQAPAQQPLQSQGYQREQYPGQQTAYAPSVAPSYHTSPPSILTPGGAANTGATSPPPLSGAPSVSRKPVQGSWRDI